jgi:hypothetical protein
LLARLRSTPEWRYVDREVEVRLARHAPSIQQHLDGLGKDDLE